VTGRACESPFEWYAHRAEAAKAGVEPEVIAALLERRMPDGIAAADAAVIRYAQELNATNSVSEATYAEALALFGAKTLVELTALVGYYTMVAMTLNAHEIPLPAGETPAFPWPHAAG
ncbi:MAG: carboxymuconolactone decarboxylase family protein, partial [Burkholderiales bacterium]|nr:carboxymuconolactone decarboxylase family protein [Burkholderiales bacterium]